MGGGVEDRLGHSLLPAHSFKVDQESSEFLEDFPATILLLLPLFVLPQPSLHPQHSPLSQFSALLQSRCLFSAAPYSYPLPSSTPIIFFSANILSRSLCTVHWADPAGTVAAKQFMHSWHHVHVNGWEFRGGGCFTLVSKTLAKISCCLTTAFTPESAVYMREEWTACVY